MRSFGVSGTLPEAVAKGVGVLPRACRRFPAIWRSSMSFTLRPRRLVVLAGLLLPVLAQAAVPAAFTTAVTDATADASAMAGALLGIAAAVVVFMIALKFIKRIKGAA